MKREKAAYRFMTFHDSFNFFDDIKFRSNEYFVHLTVPGVPKCYTRMINTLMVEELYDKVVDLGNHMGVTYVKDVAIDRFHPNRIDNKAFWTRAKQSFPLVSICGGESKSIKRANELTLQMSEIMKLFPFLLEQIEKSTKPLKVLEIGFGYGNVFEKIKDRCEYIGIDYTIPKYLKKYKNFIEIDKSGIPDYLLGENYFDIIYAVNVLQHCSQKDRFDYFKQGYSALKPGGYFLFSCFLMTKINEDRPCWGVKDKTGRGYTHFFNQLTEVDVDTELFKYLGQVGFEPVSMKLDGNNFSMMIQKPK